MALFRLTGFEGMTIFLRHLFLPLALGLMLLAWPLLTLAQDRPPDLEPTTEQVLESLLDDFLAGASVNDPAAHARFWAGDLIYTSSSGQRFGKAAILEGLEATPADSTVAAMYSADSVQIQDFGTTAVIAFRLLAHQDGDIVERYFNTGVFRKRDGQWRAVTWQATRIPEAAED